LIRVDQLSREVDRFGVIAARIVGHQLQLAGRPADIPIFLQKHGDGVLLLLSVGGPLSGQRGQHADRHIGCCGTDGTSRYRERKHD
jgi:hypothetical protein